MTSIQEVSGLPEEGCVNFRFLSIGYCDKIESGRPAAPVLDLVMRSETFPETWGKYCRILDCALSLAGLRSSMGGGADTGGLKTACGERGGGTPVEICRD